MTTAPPRQGQISAVPETQLRAAAEAVLVVADGPVTCAALAEALGVGEARARGLLESLAAEYAGDGDGPARGFVLRRAAGGWRLASAPAFHDLVERASSSAGRPPACPRRRWRPWPSSPTASP